MTKLEKKRMMFADHITRQEKSGMVPSTYCRENNVKLDTFMYYKSGDGARILNKSQSNVGMRKPSGFVKVGESMSEKTYRVEVGKAVVHVPESDLQTFLSNFVKES